MWWPRLCALESQWHAGEHVRFGGRGQGPGGRDQQGATGTDQQGPGQRDAFHNNVGYVHATDIEAQKNYGDMGQVAAGGEGWDAAFPSGGVTRCQSLPAYVHCRVLVSFAFGACIALMGFLLVSIRAQRINCGKLVGLECG